MLGRGPGPAHWRRWTAAAFRMSRWVRGELGFKASRSIRRFRATFLWTPDVQFKAAWISSWLKMSLWALLPPIWMIR